MGFAEGRAAALPRTARGRRERTALGGPGAARGGRDSSLPSRAHDRGRLPRVRAERGPSGGAVGGRRAAEGALRLLESRTFPGRRPDRRVRTGGHEGRGDSRGLDTAEDRPAAAAVEAARSEPPLDAQASLHPGPRPSPRKHPRPRRPQPAMPPRRPPGTSRQGREAARGDARTGEAPPRQQEGSRARPRAVRRTARGTGPCRRGPARTGDKALPQRTGRTQRPEAGVFPSGKHAKHVNIKVFDV